MSAVARDGTPFEQALARREAASVSGQVVDESEARLEELAWIANREHRQAIAKGRELLEHAICCGSALVEARAQVERGMWLDWVERNVEIHITTVHRYMRLAEHAELVRRSDAESIEGAMRELADLPRHGHGPRGYTDADKREWIKLVDQVGVKRAARALGVAPSTIWKWCSPNSPDRARPSRLGAPIPFTDDVVERLAGWLVGRFADQGYFVRVTREVREDARQALLRAFDEAAASERPVEQAALEAAGVEEL